MDPLAWGLLLLAVGLVLAVLEFLLPSGGLLAAASALCVIAALVVPFMAEEGAWWRATIVTLAAVVGIPAALRTMLTLWPKSPFGRLLLIDLPKRPDDVLPEEAVSLRSVVGSIGTTRSPMRPSGTIEIDGVYYPAASEGMPIEKGAIVKAIAVRMRQVIVVPAREADLAAWKANASRPVIARSEASVAPRKEPISPVRRSAGAPGSMNDDVRATLDDDSQATSSDQELRRTDELAASIEALGLSPMDDDACESDESRS